jgi:hypothetical protein
MRFEKWQALGNDYMIIERDALDFELTPPRVRAICAPHFGCGADGILLLGPGGDAAHVAQLRIFNPDGSEAELSGNGVREAVLYLRRAGWTGEDQFTIETAAGEIAPTLTGPGSASIAMGRASTTSADFPTGDPDGRGMIDVGGAQRAFHGGARGARSGRRRSRDRGLGAVPEPHQRQLLATRGDGGAPHPRAHLRARGGRDALVGNRCDRRRDRCLPAGGAEPDHGPPRRR